MYPVLFRLPYLEIPVPTYGVLLVMALFTGIQVGVINCVRYGLDRQLCAKVAFRGVIAGLVGAKVFWGLLKIATGTPWQQVLSPEFILGGGSYYGGFLFALVVSAGLAAYYRLPGWTVADAFAPGIVLGQAIGRLGCFAAGCCWGTPTRSWIGVEFTGLAHQHTGVPAGITLHPVQMYEAVLDLGLFLFLMWLRDRRRYSGQIMLIYIVLYGLIRFVIEFYRGEPTHHLGPLSTFQTLALILVLLSLLVMAYRRRIVSQTIP